MDHSLPGSSVYGIPRQEYWSGLPFSFLGDLSISGIKAASPALADLCFSNSWHCLQSAALPSLSMFCRQVSLPQLLGPGSCSSCVPVCVLCVGPGLRKRNCTCFSKKPQKCPCDLSVVPIRPVRNCDGAMKFKSPSLSRRLS